MATVAAPTSMSSQNNATNVTIQDIVFSCGICQATVSELYAVPESNQGFHIGSGDHEGIVIKIWLTECAHVICANHLDGEAPSFHPEGTRPSARCPICVQTLGDQSYRELYWIRGFKQGEFDLGIPDAYLSCSALTFNDEARHMDAFQYGNVVRYALAAHRACKIAKYEGVASDVLCSNERKLRRQLQKQVQSLQVRIEVLENAEAKLKKWEARKGHIKHYMGIVGDMSEDIAAMREQLRHLGYDYVIRNYGLNARSIAQPQLSDLSSEMEEQAVPSSMKSTVANSLAHQTLTALQSGRLEQTSSPTRKRKLSAIAAEGKDRMSSKQAHRSSSRDMMPPPAQLIPNLSGHGHAQASRVQTHFGNRPMHHLNAEIPDSAQDRYRTPVADTITHQTASPFDTSPAYRSELGSSRTAGRTSAELRGEVALPLSMRYPMLDHYIPTRTRRVHDLETRSVPNAVRSSLMGFKNSYEPYMRRLSLSTAEVPNELPAFASARDGEIPDVQRRHCRWPVQPQISSTKHAAPPGSSQFFSRPASTNQAHIIAPSHVRDISHSRHSGFLCNNGNLTRQPKTQLQSPFIRTINAFSSNSRTQSRQVVDQMESSDLRSSIARDPTTHSRPQASRTGFYRPSLPAPSGPTASIYSHANTHEISSMPRHRISLPPTTKAIPVRNQDRILSQIPGVRGSSHAKHLGSQVGYLPTAAFSGSRQLHSAASSRRSVRR